MSLKCSEKRNSTTAEQSPSAGEDHVMTEWKLELPPRGCMPPPTSRVAVYIHVCPGSYNICSEDFEGIKQNGKMEVITILTCMIQVNNFHWETCWLFFTKE